LSRELVPFHPARLVLERDESENKELQPGDVVTFFSQRDLQVPVMQQRRQVRLEGEFVAPGVYEVTQAETLGELIERIGGLTPNAYLYGSEFTRESARNDQQERIDQYVRDLERNSSGAASRNLARLGEEGNTAETRSGQDGLQRTLESLRSIKATGRISLGFSEDNTSLAKLMDLPLEDGDRMVVRSRPSTVTVIGAVYNAGALLYEGQWRVKDYLNRVGGGTRMADRARVYLIRADGTVVSKQNFGRFGPSFDMERLHPGDSIVVPEVLPKPSLLRNARDWAQLSSQLMLGSAAVNVLR